MRHSQRCNESLTTSWIIFDNDGSVISAHCNCKAGLGEVCSHVAASLFYIEAYGRIRGKLTCTQMKNQWIVPPHVKSIECLPISKISFTSAKSLKTQLDAKIKSVSGSKSLNTTVKTISVRKYDHMRPSNDDAAHFYSNLACASADCAILSLISEHNSVFVPPVRALRLLSSYFCTDYMTLSLEDLLIISKQLSIEVTQSECVQVEQETRQQSRQLAWFDYRAGRVTASRLYAVCHTSVVKPSVSLLKSVCYPKQYSFRSAATAWGCEHEQEALDRYTAFMQAEHQDFVLTNV